MSNKFTQRSGKSELLDASYIPKELLFKNLHELDIINRALGGHSISLNGIKKLMTDKNKTYHIVDLGCGSGDTLIYIAKWARKEGYKVKLTGVDKNVDAIYYMTNHCKIYSEINGVANDYHNFLETGITVDIIHCSLFCHHLSDTELKELFNYFKHYAQTGFVINDLHRHWLAYYGVYAITRLLNGSILSKNDGPISVLRAFKKKELEILLNESQIKKYTIAWKLAFRYLVVGHSDKAYTH